jgi:hypothetical protein
MKNAFTHIAIGFGLLLFVASTGCKKCHICVVKDQDKVTRYQYPEMCGNKNDLSAYADKCESEYGKYDHTCTCGEAP